MTLRITPAEIVAKAEASGRPGLLATAPGWPRVRLGDVATVVNGAAFSSQFFNIDGDGMPLIRIRDVGATRIGTWYSGPWEERYRVRRGDLLVGMDGDFRVTTWKVEDGLLNQRVCRIDVDEEQYDRRFLVLVLQGYLDAIQKATSSTTVKHLSSRSVADIPLPHPDLTHQRRLADLMEDHLSRLDAGNDYLQAARQRLDNMRRAAVWDALTGSDAPGDRNVTLARADTEDGGLPALPHDWTWTRLGDVADVVGGVTKDAKKESAPDVVEVPYLRVANVQRGRLDLGHVTAIRVPRAKAESLRLLPGDVLLNEGGDRDKLGRGWVWEGQIEHCIHQNHVFRARVRDDQLDPYLLSWAGNYIGGAWCERNGRQSVNLASISLSKIRLMPVPVPPRHLQAVIRGRVEAVFESTARLEAALLTGERRAVGLRRALLNAAFSGRLTGRNTDSDVVEELVEVAS
ncbi:restriction endonuclease subunit S [Blastococcus sp. TF02-8]|uniref:restriction endonuclease subunit S n=1 Tax=Blastococcus sp. TF02-8 TaxID=2250574 RepID=UPI000DE8C1AA|nr:restriction endonuclease subunit S [Blastococcus sp. TF02-8]RBY96866.1 restriction endonuclease subunit S [Blastococcus sp. TF02-8]